MLVKVLVVTLAVFSGVASDQSGTDTPVSTTSDFVCRDKDLNDQVILISLILVCICNAYYRYKLSNRL